MCKNFILLCFALLCVVSMQAQGQLEEVDFDNISLEELLSLKVTSASKRVEDAFDAPSVITSISAQEISDFGARNIYEVLERSASFYGLSSYFFPSNVIGLRGNLPSHINPNILFLIDGRPFRESVKGGQQVALLTAFPLNVIQKIEIIRGPGSVLYGTNAFVGVVNIITKRKGDASPIIIDVSGGNLSSFKCDAAWVGSIKEKVDISAGLNYYHTKGWEFSDSLHFQNQARYGENHFGQDALGAFLNINYNNISLNSFLGTNTLGKVHNTGEAADYLARRCFVDLAYVDTLTSWYSFNANITYNRINDIFWVDAPNDLAYEIEANDFIYELTNHFTITDKWNVLLGGSVSLLSGEQYFGDSNSIGGEVVPYPIEPYNTIWYNAYLQSDYSPTEWLKFVAGVQANQVPSTAFDFTPRVSAIARANNGLGVKLMYGRAFRAPFPGETKIYTAAVRGVSDLIPQKIQTYEIQAFYSKPKGNIALTYFNSMQKDIIDWVDNDNANYASRFQYANIGRMDSWGLELEGKVVIDERLFLTGSYAYQYNKNINDLANGSLLPNGMLKIGASYDFRELFSISVFDQYYTSPYNYSDVYKNEDDYVDRNRTGEGELSSFHWLTAKLKVDMNTVFGFASPKVKLTTEMVNVLNKTVYNPEMIFNGFDAIQTRANRTSYLGLQFTF